MACAVLVPLLSFRSQSELMGCYLPAMHRVVEGLPLPGAEWWVYPPLFTTPVIPLVWLPIAAARMAWCIMLVTAAVLSARCIWKTLMLDESFRRAVKTPWMFFLFVGVLAVSSAGHTIVPLGYQAHDVLVCMLIAMGAWFTARGFAITSDRPRRTSETCAGMAFGLAASCKVMPILFLPVLVAQRRWRAALAMCVTGLLAAVCFDLVALACTGKAHFIAWVQLAAGGGDLLAAGGGRWDPWNPLNQSGTGILNRLMIPTPTDRGLDHECMIVQVSDGGRRMVLGVWSLLLVSSLLLVAWKTSLAVRTRLQRDGCSAPLHALALCGATACAYVLIAPHSSNYHFAPLALASAAMLGFMVTRGVDGWMALCLAVMVGIELIPGRDVLGGRLADIKLAYGSVGLCAFFGMLGALRVMIRSARTT